MKISPLVRLVCFLCLSYSVQIFALPDKLIFATQPSYAERYRNNQLNDNIVVKLADSLNITLELYVCPWARCVKALQTGEADIIDDLFYAKDRNEFISYLEPNFAHQDAGFRFFADNRAIPLVSSWSHLKALRIGALRGYKYFPKFDEDTNLKVFYFNDLETLVNMTLIKRLDVFIASPSFDEESILPFDKERVLTRQPLDHLESLPLYMGISRQSKWMEFQIILEHKLVELLLQQQQAIHAIKP